MAHRTDLRDKLRVKPGQRARLARLDPGATFGHDRASAQAATQQALVRLGQLQDRLWAESKRAALVVLQGIDAAGKDGLIKHVLSGVNPQGVRVHSFKAPSDEELDHDYLWRCVQRLAARGEIGIFNRSHYEEVLVVRVHPELLDRQKLPAEDREHVWKRRYREINAWERHLVDNGFRVVKLCLNVSKEEQRLRFLKRLEVPEKNWKFASGDIRERAFWDDYQAAYSEMLSNTSTEWAPWYVIPADRKWFARIAAAAVIAHTLIELDPRYPTVSEAQKQDLAAAQAELEAEEPGP